MAPNPSAALRVVLAAALAAGTAAVTAYAEIPPTKDEPGSSFIVLRVGKVVPTYGSVMIRAAQLKGMKPGEEREVEALFPKQMSNLGRANVFGWSIPYSANHYQVNAQSEKVKVKMSGTASSPSWALARNGVYLKDGDKDAVYPPCIPNGDRSCFDAIRGIARRFDVVATAAPAQPAPAPVPPAPNRPAPVPPVAGQPPAPPAAPESLKDWSFLRNEDGVVLALGKGTLEGAKSRAASCPDGFVTVPLLKFAFADDKKGQPLAATAEAAGSLKVYKTGPSGQPMAQCPKDKDCNADGVDVRLSACESATSCQGLTINRPDEKRSGTPFVAADLERPFVAKAAGTPVSGKAVVAPTPSEKCSGSAPDPLAGKLKDLLGDDKGALALARVAQKVWTGSPTFQEALEAALKNPDKAKGKAEFLAKAQTQVLADPQKSAGFIKADPPLKDDFKEAYCKPSGGTPPPAVTKTSTTIQEAGAQVTDTNRIDGRGTNAVVGGAGSPYAMLCSLLEDSQSVQTPGGGFGRVPDIAGERPTTTPDKAPADTAAEDAKKKKDLQRMAIGGMGGALVLGVFGFIFGGPIGAIAMGAIGFGLMAGVTYLNNNPIDK
ncbi:hypothetical protein EPO15_05485 [bacterium]|nr:MAG: hypothetical protein EPO15_05485 [bacterium]